MIDYAQILIDHRVIVTQITSERSEKIRLRGEFVALSAQTSQ